MSDLFVNHIVGFPMGRLIFCDFDTVSFTNLKANSSKH